MSTDSRSEHHKVFITGGTGYIGRQLIPHLVARRHEVRALARPGSEARLPRGCTVIQGDALDKASFVRSIPPSDTLVQLVGVAHPNPSKAHEFRTIDLASVRASVEAAVEAGIQHFVYISVAQPAPAMRSYVEARTEGEALIRRSGMNATILRPWYVLGPGHRWPYVLLPFYWLCELIPATREAARRLGLVTLDQMVGALVESIENPPARVRVLTVPQIRVSGISSPSRELSGTE